MSLNSLNKEIARHIVLSQIASDGGKGIYEISIAHSGRIAEKGYHVKDKHILTAIQLINKAKGQSPFTYYSEKKDDQNGNPSKIIYFTLRKDGKRYQVSFHTFAGDEIKEMAEAKKGLKTHWDHKSSRMACQKIIELFNL